MLTPMTRRSCVSGRGLHELQTAPGRGPLRVCFEYCKEGGCVGVGVRRGDCALQGRRPQGLVIPLAPRPLWRVIRAVGKAFHGGPCLLKPRQTRVYPGPCCAPERQRLVGPPPPGQRGRGLRMIGAELSRRHR